MGCPSSTLLTRAGCARSAIFLPDVPEGSQRVQSNDVTANDRGLFYLLDRLRE
jgi:hypothetical protein